MEKLNYHLYMIFLDANENPFNEPYNRYPDPLQWAVKGKIAELKKDQLLTYLTDTSRISKTEAEFIQANWYRY